MTDSTATRITREARMRWVPIDKMKVSPLAQRELNQARVDKIAANLDVEQLGTPTVNERNQAFYVIDGQHRVEALRQIGYGDQNVQCWCYVGLTEEEEAETFLKLNDVLAVHAFDRFRVGVVAGRDIESDIDRVVRALGLCVSRDQIPGAIAAVGTLRRIYIRSGPSTLRRALQIARDAYGDPGLDRDVLGGMGYLCERYNGQLDEAEMARRLNVAHGGVNALLGKAELHRRSTGLPKGQCVAAAAVDIYNGQRGGKKLPSWWKDGQ